MRRLVPGLLLLAVGCDAVSMLILPPDGMPVIAGGISDTRPYFGRVRVGLADGELLIASCGCGDWRALVSPDDGSKATQFAVRFYSASDYVPTGPVTVYGDVDEGALRATLDQDSGLVDGWLRVGPFRTPFQATRGDNHGASAGACARCHTGNDPIYPQPPDHPPFELDPANCLDCHDAN